jgi:8-oxo-dGTP pyrophosphatase MutT (NUDIX family)
VRDGDRLLVYEGYDSVKDERFYRPLGGGIEFGELGAEAVAREVREELGATVSDVRFLGVLESVFTYAGEPGHELVLMYEVALADPGRGRDASTGRGRSGDLGGAVGDPRR